MLSESICRIGKFVMGGGTLFYFSAKGAVNVVFSASRKLEIKNLRTALVPGRGLNPVDRCGIRVAVRKKIAPEASTWACRDLPKTARFKIDKSPPLQTGLKKAKNQGALKSWACRL